MNSKKWNNLTFDQQELYSRAVLSRDNISELRKFNKLKNKKKKCKGYELSDYSSSDDETDDETYGETEDLYQELQYDNYQLNEKLYSHENLLNEYKIFKEILHKYVTFNIGTPVKIFNLLNNVELNGKTGIINSFDNTKARYIVIINEYNKPYSIKPDNIRLNIFK
tara:strand:+ start:93 stop:590 length:498 start_codon:yes stop_codon:yes gene_type:complete